MTKIEFLDDMLQNYRSSSREWVTIKKGSNKKKKQVGKKPIPKKNDFKTPVKLVYDAEESQMRFPMREALFGLPPQVAFNLACILTKKRSAFQIDYEDREPNEHSALVKQIKKAANAIKPETILN